MSGESVVFRLATSVASEAESLAVRLGEDVLPSLSSARSAAAQNIAARAGIVSETVEYPVLDQANSVTDGGLRFRVDGLADLSDGLSSRTLAYRKADEMFFLHQPEGHPFDVSRSFQRGFLSNPDLPSHAPLNRFGPFGVRILPMPGHGWDKLAANELEAVAKALPDGSMPIGLGRSRQAWLPPAGEHAVVIGPRYERPQVPGLLQAVHSELIGQKQIEWFPLGESDSIRQSDIWALEHRMKLAGWFSDDQSVANYVRVLDGSVWRVDPEDIYKMSGQSQHDYSELWGKR